MDNCGCLEKVHLVEDGRVAMGVASVVGARRRMGAAGGAEEDQHCRGPQRRQRASLKGGGEAGRHRSTVWQSSGGGHMSREWRRGPKNWRRRGVCVCERERGGAGARGHFFDKSITSVGDP
jgi:hypothetical protein